MDGDSAYALISQAIAAGHPAHGYLVTGDLRAACRPLAERVLADLFPGADLTVHPDIHWLAPEKKSRIISMESMCEKMIAALETTAFSGGWKVGVVMGADCLHPSAANAFLKTLEEPPPKTMFFLLTDSPERLLPTVVSRCQRIDLGGARGRGLAEPYRGAVLAVLARPDLASALARQTAADDLVEILEKLKEKAAKLVDAEIGAVSEAAAETDSDEYNALVSSRYREFRTEFLITLSGFFAEEMRRTARGVGSLRRLETYYDLDAVEELALSLNRNISEAVALSFFMDRVRFPKPEGATP